MPDTLHDSVWLYRQFFLIYPGIWQSAIAKSEDSALPEPIWWSLTAKSGKSLLRMRMENGVKSAGGSFGLKKR